MATPEMRWNAQASIPSRAAVAEQHGPPMSARWADRRAGQAVELGRGARRRATIASANSLVPADPAQVVGDVRALGDDVADGAPRRARPPPVSPRWRSIRTPERISAVGLALFWPAYLGAEPWTASKTAASVPMFAPGRHAQPADQAGAQVADDVAVEVRQHQHVVQLGLLDELHAHVVDDAVLELDPALVARRRPSGSSRGTGRRRAS